MKKRIVLWMVGAFIVQYFQNNLERMILSIQELIVEDFVGDFIVTTAFIIASALSVLIFILTEEIGKVKDGKGKTNRVWLFLSAGFFLGAMGEIFDLHNILSDFLAIGEHLGVTILTLYCLGAGILLIIFTGYFRNEGLALYLFIFGFSAQAIAVLSEYIETLAFLEDGCEIFAAFMYLEFTIMAYKKYLKNICSH